MFITIMDWNQARQLLGLRRRQADASQPIPGPRVSAGPDALAPLRAGSICVASGKGGTGKSLVTASLAVQFARKGRTLLVDADLGVANAHILQDVHPDKSLVDVVEGRCDVGDVVTQASENLHLLSGGSGFSRMAGLSAYELHLVSAGIEKLELEYRHLLVDSAAGLSVQTVAFAAASDLVVLVTTPDVTAMTDAYAFLKVLFRRKPHGEVLLVVNRASDRQEAHHTAHRISEVSRRFLGRAPRWIGTLPEDRAAFRCTQRRRPVVCGEPESDLGRALAELAHTLDEQLASTRTRGLGRSLMRRVAWSPDLVG
jgi:flagellar biosynthesis protein FlhG